MTSPALALYSDVALDYVHGYADMVDRDRFRRFTGKTRPSRRCWRSGTFWRARSQRYSRTGAHEPMIPRDRGFCGLKHQPLSQEPVDPLKASDVQHSAQEGPPSVPVLAIEPPSPPLPVPAPPSAPAPGVDPPRRSDFAYTPQEYAPIVAAAIAAAMKDNCACAKTSAPTQVDWCAWSAAPSLGLCG
jgi:hypothetical protein